MKMGIGWTVSGALWWWLWTFKSCNRTEFLDELNNHLQGLMFSQWWYFLNSTDNDIIPWLWKVQREGSWREWLCHILKYCPIICLKKLRKTTKDLGPNSQSLDQDSDPWFPRYWRENANDYYTVMFSHVSRLYYNCVGWCT